MAIAPPWLYDKGHAEELCWICKPFTERTWVARDLNLIQPLLKQARWLVLAPSPMSDLWSLQVR